jgi:hypothetical protein
MSDLSEKVYICRIINNLTYWEMKRVVLLLFMAISIFLNGNAQLSVRRSIVTEEKQNDTVNEMTAGDYLIRSAKFKYASIALGVASGIILILPDFSGAGKKELKEFQESHTTDTNAAKSNKYLLMSSGEYQKKMDEINKKIKHDRDANYALGGIFAAASLVCYILSIEDIRIAGKKMNIQASSNSVGVAINF